MSVDDSNDSVFQTPESVIVAEHEKEHQHPELESVAETRDIGASPTLGPVTRSGKKRRHVVPVKSAGKKKTKMSALAGLTFEMGFLAVPGLLYLAWQCGYLGLPTGVDPAAPQLTLFTTSWWMNLLLLGSGVATLLPLALYATAVKHIPLSTVGLLQFIGPTIQFLIGLFLYQEAFDRSRFIGFVVVWMGVGLYLISIRQSKDVAVSKDTATTQE